MVGIILTGHGQFASGLASAVEMVAGQQEHFRVVTFTEAEAATYGDTLKAAIAEMRAATDEVVVYVDLLGGTPFNQSMMASQEIDNVSVITGTNLPMLIEPLFLRNMDNSMTAEAFVSTALNIGKDGITTKTLAPVAEAAADDEDGI